MKRLLIILLSTLITFLSALSLEECINAGLDNSKELEIQESNQDLSKLGKLNTYLSFIPSANITGNSTKIKDTDLASKWQFTVSENLYLFDSRFYNMKKSELSYKNAKLEYSKKEKAKIVEIISHYLDLLSWQGYLEVYENAVKRYEKEIEFTKELIKAGKRTELDLYSLRIDKKEYEKQLRQYKNNLKTTRRELERITGLNDFTKITPFREVDNNFAEMGEVLKKNYDFQQQKLNLEKTKVEKSESFKNIIPDFFANGQYSYQENFDIYGDKAAAYANSWQVSLNFSYELGGWAQNFNNYQIRKKKTGISKLNTEILKEKIIKQYEAGLDDLSLKKTEMKLDKEKLVLSEKNFKLSASKYRSGLISFLDYTDAQNKLIESKMDYRKSKNDYFKKLADFQKFTGSKIFGKY